MNEDVKDKTLLRDSYSAPLDPYMLLNTVNDLTYFEDPVLTFEDSLIFGCSLHFTYDELEDFCTKDLQKHLMLF